MHDPRLVRLGQALGNLRRNVEELLDRQRAGVEQLPKRLALDSSIAIQETPSVVPDVVEP